MRQHIRRDAGAVVGDVQRELGRRRTSARIAMRVPAGVWATALPRHCQCAVRRASHPRAPAAGRPEGRPGASAPRRAGAPHSRRARRFRARSIQSSRSSSAPASIRVIASRLRTISSRPSASTLISAEQVALGRRRRACRHTRSGSSRSRGSRTAACGNHARSRQAAYCAPARSRSRLALTMSRASEARSSAAAVCSASVSSSARASESSGGVPLVLGDADDTEGLVADAQRHEEPRDDRQGRGVGARRLVVRYRPSARPSWRRDRAASSGGHAAVSSRSSSRASITTAARPRLAWISLAAPSATASSAASAGKPAREFVEPPHRAHPARRDPGLRRARGRPAPK